MGSANRGLLYFMVAMGLFCSTSPVVYAQGNTWINNNQVYFKIKTAKDGLYRITYNDLVEANFPVSIVDPRRLQLFHRGVEQAIFVEGQLDARIDPQDYIEFYGKVNDGTLDRELYMEDAAQPHNAYNIYSDSVAYFLTWSLNQNGRRMSAYKENNVENLPIAPYAFKQKTLLQTSNYSGGRHYPLGSRSAETLRSDFDFGEGWTGPSIRKDNSQTFELQLDEAFRTGPVPELKMILAGRNNLPHRAEIFVGSSLSTLRSVGLATAEYHDHFSFTTALAWSDVSASGVLFVRMLVRGYENSDPDFISVSLVQVKYPGNWNQQGLGFKKYEAPENPSGKTYVEMANVPANAQLLDITQSDAPIRIGYNIVGSGINAIVQSTNSVRRLVLCAEINQGSKLKKVDFRQINPANHNYLIITHPRMRLAAGGYQDPVEAYAAYRASTIGGAFDTLTVNIDQLYDQFSYGEKTPLAIRNFIKFMAAAQPERPHLFLIGKGLTPNYNSHRENQQTEAIIDLVPTAGYPGNDMLFSTEINGSGFTPYYATGRLATTNSLQVANYLSKIIETESMPYDDLWRKGIVHLSGGRGVTEQTAFRSYVDQFRAVAIENYFGAAVTTQSKKTNNSTELINISQEVNNGKSLITFFGHSGAVGTDIEIGFASNDELGYRNKGKYPVILVNGCNAGDTFFKGYGFGEDWIATPDRGAKAFLAHTSVGISTYLRQYTNIFYATALGDSLFINKGIGDIQREIGLRYLDIFPPTAIHITQIQQMSLQGDPAIKLFAAEKPDYALSESQVFVSSNDGQTVNAFSESFELGIAVKNFGMATTDSVEIIVRRTLSNGTLEIYGPITYPPVFHADTLFVTIPGSGQVSYGNNQFDISIAIVDNKPELSTQNNRIIYNFFMPLGGVSCLYPSDLSVVSSNQISLYAQSLNLLTGNRMYEFELDTSRFFNSPIKKRTTLQAKALAKWQTELFNQITAKDSLVFYWRSRFADPRPGELASWDVRSFMYINEHPLAWNMAHFQQFGQIQGQGIIADQDSRTWKFENFTTNIRVQSSGIESSEAGQALLEINDVAYIFSTRLCTNNSVNMVAFESTTTSPYLGVRFSAFDGLDRRSCGRVPNVINNFLNSEITGAQRYIELYINAIDNGDYVLLFTLGDVLFETWPESTIAKLAEIGVDPTDLQQLENGQPLIILGKKGGDVGSAIFITAPEGEEAKEATIELNEEINGFFDNGILSSPVVGPVKSWGALHFEATKPVGYPGELAVDVIGINSLNQETVLRQDINTFPADLSDINALQYPSLKLKLSIENFDDDKVVQLKKWMITYEGLPEGILLPQFETDELPLLKQEGEDLSVAFIFENVSAIPYTDSLMVRFNVFNSTESITYRDSLRIVAPKSREAVAFDTELSTIGREGDNSLMVQVNPQIFPEISYTNNRIDLNPFYKVESDNISPLLEVTIDGRFILDGEIVSPTPRILMRMKDNNRVRPKTDTLGMEVSLKKPCATCQYEKVAFSNQSIRWTPASEDNDFSIEYEPEDLENGMHSLRVMMRDASGNEIGPEPFQVSFEVINESTITNFYPYPNPFSTSVKFVFTLTGANIPENFIIQIMTISGRIVREISADEIGPIRIGNNISQYAWDGRDEFGDQLANGVYLYKVKFDTKQDTPEHRSTSGDRAFKKGFGKLYLLK